MKIAEIEKKLNRMLIIDNFSSDIVLSLLKKAVTNKVITGIKCFDFTRNDTTELEKIRQQKIIEVEKNKNYELAANLRDSERTIQQSIKLQKELKITESKIAIDDSTLIFYNLGTNTNDELLMNVIIRNFEIRR